MSEFADLTPAERMAIAELRQGSGLYYVAQEAAFAPGIAGEWPQIVRAPQSKHGRLVRRYWPVSEKGQSVVGGSETQGEGEPGASR